MLQESRPQRLLGNEKPHDDYKYQCNPNSAQEPTEEEEYEEGEGGGGH